jgi:hypothetical protein
MAQDTDDTIRAKVIRYLDREGVYYPRHDNIDKVATRAPVATSDEGRAKELAHDMARDDSYPVRYVHIDDSVCLKVDSQRWAASRIQSLDPSVLTWSQEDRL